MWCVAKSHHLLTLDLAERAANEAEHKEERGDPHGIDGVEVISHGPDESGIPDGGCSHRFRADAVVLGEEEASSCDQDSELEHADEVGEVDGADSPSISPGADEHCESVEGDKEVDEAQKTSDQSELRSLSLAIDITLLKQLKPISSEVTVDLDIVVSVVVGDGEGAVGSVPSVHL